MEVVQLQLSAYASREISKGEDFGDVEGLVEILPNDIKDKKSGFSRAEKGLKWNFF